MELFRRQSDEKGFTLSELLVVVAIILVLVAIAIPVFTGAMSQTEKATCEANKRSIKAIYTNSFLLDQEQNKEDLFQRSYDSLLESNGGRLCPRDGIYTSTFAEDGSCRISCNIHDGEWDEQMSGWISKNSWNGQDLESRKKYAAANGITKWTPVKGTDGKTYYLQFKTYDNKSETSFLYAGLQQDINKQSGDTWTAKYVCDNNGLLGEKGQWYELSTPTSIGYKPDSNAEDLKKLLSGQKVDSKNNPITSSKVKFENGKFVTA